MTGQNKGTRFWQLAVVLLVVCNMALMLTIWIKPHTEAGPMRETPRDFVVRTLKFTDTQTQQYDVLVKEHQQAMRRLRQEAMGYRQQLFDNLHSGNSRFADSLGQMIADNQKQIELVTYNHFVQVRALCSDAQKAEFDQVIGEVVKKMNGPGNGGPPHRRGDGPPPGDMRGPPPPGGEGGPPPPGGGNPPPLPGGR